MIEVGEIVSDMDMMAPQTWTIQRSTGQWVSGGFQSSTVTLYVSGPVQQANNREISMLPESDRAGEIRSFYLTQPIYITRETLGTVPSMVSFAVSGSTLVLSSVPAAGFLVYKNGAMLVPEKDYTVSGNTVSLVVQPSPNDSFMVVSLDSGDTGPAISDVLVYEGWQYRVLQTYHTPGSRYWKAFATRLQLA